MKSLLDLIKSLYGPKAISSTIGTRTNVIRLPSGNLQKYIKTDLNIEAASDAAAKNAYNEMQQLIPEVPKMNDAERLIFEGNLRRLKNKIKPEEVTAEVFKFETKEPVSKEGITQLIEEAGQTARPGTIAGNIESRLNRLKALSKEEGLTMQDVIGDFAKSQQSMSKLQDEGLVRATARQILINDIKAGKIKNMTVEEAINIKEPIEPFRTIYGEGALEQLDSLIPELRSLRTETEAEKLARSKFEFEPKSNRPKESYTEEEMKKILEEPEKKANGGAMGLDYLTGMEPPKGGYATGGRIQFRTGGGKKFLDLINKANKESKITKQIKEFTDDEMLSYIKKYKEEGPTLEEFTKKVNEETGSNFTPEQLAHAYRIKVAYPHSTPIVDTEGKFIGGGLYNPPLDVSISDRETLTKSIIKTRKEKGLDIPEKYQQEKAGEGRFTKQEVLEKIIQKTIDANPTDEYVQKTFPNFIKEIRANPELAKNENVWKTFTQDFPENKRLVVYGDDTVDFFTKGENLPEGMKQTKDLADTYGISMEEAMRIKQMEPQDQVMEIKKLEVLKKRTENAKGGSVGLDYLMGF